MKKELSKKEVQKLVFSSLKEKDWGKKDKVEYKTTAVLLASALVGGFGKKIARLLGYTEEFGDYMEKISRKNGIWDKRGKVHADWMDKKNGAVALACDTAVCLGWLKRSESPGKEIAKKRWEGKSKKERLNHSRMMNTRRWKQ